MAQIPIHRVLLATDFSPGSMAALPYAVAVARHFRSKLYFAHVIPDAESNGDGAVNATAHVEEQMEALRAMANEVALEHEVLIGHGDIWPILSIMLEEHSIDLLVIGTRGRRGVEKLLLGSTAEQILQTAQTPLLIVGPQASIPAEAEGRLRRVLYATDFSPESEAALHFAYSLAKHYAASLAFVHVADNVWREPLSTRLRAADFIEERLVERQWPLPDQRLATEYHVEFGPRADSILDVAAKFQAELIVLGVRGARHPQIAAHLPGPTAYDVVSRAQCPVLVVRGSPAETAR
ncbi:MAG: universal stress protein [Actinomycetota bacterium]